MSELDLDAVPPRYLPAILAHRAIVSELDAYGAAVAHRDELIRRAHHAKIPKAEIMRRMGVGQRTIDRAVAAENVPSAGVGAGKRPSPNWPHSL